MQLALRKAVVSIVGFVPVLRRVLAAPTAPTTSWWASSPSSVLHRVLAVIQPLQHLGGLRWCGVLHCGVASLWSFPSCGSSQVLPSTTTYGLLMSDEEYPTAML